MSLGKNKGDVIARYPLAFLHPTSSGYVIWGPEDSAVIGSGSTPVSAWANAAKRMVERRRTMASAGKGDTVVRVHNDAGESLPMVKISTPAAKI